MDPHDTTRPTRPDVPRATAPPTHTFGPQGPTLGDLSDAYLQDYQVRQFRSHSTARGRTAHLTAFFGLAARAAALTTRCFRHQLLLPRPYLVLTKPLRLDIQCQRGASVKIGWKHLDD